MTKESVRVWGRVKRLEALLDLFSPAQFQAVVPANGFQGVFFGDRVQSIVLLGGIRGNK